MILFLIYFPKQSGELQEQQGASPNDVEVPKRRDAVVVGCSSLAALFFAGIGSLVFLSQAPALLLGWANFLGICSSVLSCIQYLPQLYTTWKLQHVMSLSVVTMFIQVPGAFLFAFSLFLRVGWQGWSSWFVFCVTGVFQGILLGMAIHFWRQEHEQILEDEQEQAEETPSETDPLLPPRRHGPRRTMNGNNKNPIGMLYSATPPEESSVMSDAGSSPGAAR